MHDPDAGPRPARRAVRRLGPTLRPGDIVILDNFSTHKVAGVQEAIEATGATLRYLPPHSPDLNPIEKLFAKLKALLRKAGKRTIDALREKIGVLLDTVSPDACRNFFMSSGYVCTQIENAPRAFCPDRAPTPRRQPN